MVDPGLRLPIVHSCHPWRDQAHNQVKWCFTRQCHWQALSCHHVTLPVAGPGLPLSVTVTGSAGAAGGPGPGRLGRNLEYPTGSLAPSQNLPCPLVPPMGGDTSDTARARLKTQPEDHSEQLHISNTLFKSVALSKIRKCSI
jgi:hypothetical protein